MLVTLLQKTLTNDSDLVVRINEIRHRKDNITYRVVSMFAQKPQFGIHLKYQLSIS
jgi:hypothetical protein